VRAEISYRGEILTYTAKGNGPIDAFVHGIKKAAGGEFTISTYTEHDINHRGSGSAAAAYISLADEKGKEHFGVGVDTNISLASIKAVISALNRMDGE